MDPAHIQLEGLPSERRFGIFIGMTLIAIGGYLMLTSVWSPKWLVYAFWSVGAGINLLAWLRPSLLRRPNIAWMHLGLFIGKFVGPIVLALVFLLVITPTAFVLRTLGRDEMRIKRTVLVSYWRKRSQNSAGQSTFTNQF